MQLFWEDGRGIADLKGSKCLTVLKILPKTDDLRDATKAVFV